MKVDKSKKAIEYAMGNMRYNNTNHKKFKLYDFIDGCIPILSVAIALFIDLLIAITIPIWAIPYLIIRMTRGDDD